MSETRTERRARERREEFEREEFEREEFERERRRVSDGRGRSRRRKKRRGIGPYIAIIIILVLAFTGFRAWLESRPGAVEPIVVASSAAFHDERVNVLFLGTNQGLSDTMMVFSFDPGKKQLDEISIPRDTYYPRSAYAGAAYQKINSVYETENFKGCAKAVSDVLGGIPIHYYVELDSEGTKKIVDAMGGVEMNVPIDMDYDDPDQNLYIHLKAGTQRLNGDQAVQYLRFRSGYANADLGRVSAQQEFLKAALAQGGGLNFAKVLLTAQGVAKTNISATAAAGFAAKAAGMSGGDFNAYTIPGKSGMQNGASYFFADEEGTKELMKQIYAQ